MGKRRLGQLTEREERFCLKYFETGVGSKSVLEAGYKNTEKAAWTTAHRLLKKPKIEARLKELREKQEKRTEITADYVLNNLVEVVERCMQRAPVMERVGREMVQATDDEGRHIWRFDATGANQALNMLGKYKKLFTEKHEHSGPDGKAIQFSDHEAAAKLTAILNAARSRKGE